MNAIQILAVVDGVDDLLLIDVLGQGQLHDETVHVRIIVELTYAVEQLFLGGILVHADKR